MRLSRLKLFGFKTFADRTELELKGNILAVVGPNGCGKSNLVDALLWALGETNPRSLRAHTAQDVIFNGSQGRKPLGFAEVMLTFDNADRALGLDVEEVEISRRVTRGGESEYSINRRTCRQKDIHELMADSGLGRAGYAIVGQREVDACLAASPVERRAWVDEAAGAQRYRGHREDALRRLNAATTHLARVEDLVREIESQREPLREEADAALRYKETVAALRRLESGLVMCDLAAAVAQIDELATKTSERFSESQAQSARAGGLEDEARRCHERLAELDAVLDEARTRRADRLAEIERAKGAIRMAEQRLSDLDAFETGLADDQSAVQRSIEEASSEIHALEGNVSARTEELARERAAAEAVGTVARGLAERLAQVERSLAEARAQAQLALRRSAELEQRARRQADVDAELAGVLADLPELERNVEAAREALAARQSEVSDRDGELAKIAADLEAVETTEREARRRASGLAAEIEALNSRRRGLEATIETYEGLAEGARAVIEAASCGRLAGDFTPVAAAFEVDAAHARAIETAFGASVHDIVVPSEKEAKAAIEFLRTERAGRVTFHPVSLMRPSKPSCELRALLEKKGVVGLAIDLVRPVEGLRPAVESLLGRIVVVEDLDVALRLAKTSGWRRLVTLGGEVLHGSGAVTGGESARSSTGIVQRRAEVTELERRLAELGGEAERARADEESSAASAGALREAGVAVGVARRSAEEELRDAAQWLAALEAELRETAKSREKLQAEAATLAQPLAELDAPSDLADVEAERDRLLAEQAGSSVGAEQAVARLRDLESALGESQRRLEAARRRLADAEHLTTRRIERQAGLAKDRERAHRSIDEAGSALEEHRRVEALVAAEIESASAERAEVVAAMAALAEQRQIAASEAAHLAESLSKLEVERARAESRRASAAERLIDEYGVSEEEALERAPSVSLEPDAAAVVGRLRREVKAFGDVNVGAIEAFRRLTERYEELSAQHDDVLRSREEVERAISELDKLTRDRFTETLERLDVAFAETFSRLFGGGEGRLVLTEPSNLLETGIDMEVTIPGKRRQRLELLSGGERALCAAAFLFALLQVKPSPLVVLDEVDAALDGRNVERFVEFVRDMSERCQFVVITHNPATIAAAPVWWGVTMQEPGVSTVAPHVDIRDRALVEVGI